MQNALKNKVLSTNSAIEETHVRELSARDPAHRLSLRANFAWTFVGNVVYAGCQWGMLVTLAKLGSAEMVGQFALALAITAPVLMFTNLQLRSIQATDALYEYRFGDYLALRLLMTGLALLTIVGITLALGYRPETALAIFIVGLAKGAEALSDLFYGLLQQHERMDRIAISMIIKGVLSLAALAGAVYLSGSIVWGAVALAAVWAVVLFAYDIPSGVLILQASRTPCRGQVELPAKSGVESLQPQWFYPTVKKLMLLSLPLGAVMLLISLNANIPRYFIEHYLGEEQLGIFAAMAYLMVAGGTVVNALGQSASPRLAQYYARSDDHAFRGLLVRLLYIGAFLGGVGVVVALVAGESLLSLIYRPEYGHYADVFTWLMVASGIFYLASFLGFAMTAARYFRAQAPLFLLATLSTVAACALLIPGGGLLGAALATVVTMLIQLLGSLFVVVKALRRMSGVSV